MATASVPQNVHEIDTAGELDWEEQIYGECCAWARQQAEAYFAELEERLHQEPGVFTGLYHGNRSSPSLLLGTIPSGGGGKTTPKGSADVGTIEV